MGCALTDSAVNTQNYSWYALVTTVFRKSTTKSFMARVLAVLLTPWTIA